MLFSAELFSEKRFASFQCPSNELSGELLSAENVEMEMKNSLVCIGTAVGNDTVAVFKTCRRGDAGDSLEYLSNVVRVFCRDLVCTADMLLGNNENVNGRHGVYILKGINVFVLVYLY